MVWSPYPISVTIMSKFCECGCGTKVNNRFVHNHHGVKSVKYIVNDSGCWIWQLSKFKTGYGKLDIEGKTLYAHRYFYEQRKGKIPDGLVLDHLCRNTLCVNPEHLEPVTWAENSRRGKNTKLTKEQVAEIRKLHATTNMYQKDIANLFGVTQPHVNRIIKGAFWRDDSKT